MARIFVLTVSALTLLLLLAGCATVEESQVPDSKDLYIGAVDKTFTYAVDGTHDSIRFRLYAGMNDHLAEISRGYYCDPECPSNATIQQAYLDDVVQDKELKKLVELIRSKTDNRITQARIAISLVQEIPYDEISYEAGGSPDRYPYQVLYDGRGVCGEKARLLAFIVRELGYGTALLYFPEEQHAVFGVMCPADYAYRGTGYCFVETTTPAIPTYGEGTYPGFGRLESRPDVIVLSEGSSINLAEEYEDAREWSRMAALIEGSGGVLEQEEYGRWLNLANKYGIETGA